MTVRQDRINLALLADWLDEGTELTRVESVFSCEAGEDKVYSFNSELNRTIAE